MHSNAPYFSFIMRYGALGTARNKFEKKSLFYLTSTSLSLTACAEEENAMLIIWEEDQTTYFSIFLIKKVNT